MLQEQERGWSALWRSKGVFKGDFQKMNCSDNDTEKFSMHQEPWRKGNTISDVQDWMEKAGTEEESQGCGAPEGVKEGR